APMSYAFNFDSSSLPLAYGAFCAFTAVTLSAPMDFVPSSQPFEDGEDLLDSSPGNPLDLLRSPRHPWLPPDNLNASADDFVDFVGTSQPFDDGEEDWSVLMTPPKSVIVQGSRSVLWAENFRLHPTTFGDFGKIAKVLPAQSWPVPFRV
ncbi:hypothetical protein FB451DRAFT_1233079, partial [Mycena latifolia]